MNIKQGLLLPITNLVTKIVTKINGYITSIQAKRKNKIYLKYANKLIATVPIESKIITNQLLQNSIRNLIQHNELSATNFVNSIKFDLFILQLNFDALSYLSTISNIVGVQPIAHPTSLIYKLQVDDSINEQSNINSNNIKITSSAVMATHRKLNTAINIELMEDIKCSSPVDILKFATQKITYEIVSSIINELVTIASNNIKTIKRRSDDDNYAHAKHIMGEIHHASMQIARNTRRGKGNFIICSPNSAEILQSVILRKLPLDITFVPKEYDGMTALAHIGDITMNNNIIYNVHISNAVHLEGKHRFLIGYKNPKSLIDAGYFHCPYIIIRKGDLTLDASTFTPCISLTTQYGTNSSSDHNNNFVQNYYRIVDADLINLL